MLILPFASFYFKGLSPFWPTVTSAYQSTFRVLWYAESSVRQAVQTLWGQSLGVRKLQFVGELRAKKIYGRAIGGNNFFASNKEPYGTPSFKAATDMPTVNSQRALPSGLRDGPREVFPAKKLSPPIAAAKMQSLSKVFVFEHSP